MARTRSGRGGQGGRGGREGRGGRGDIPIPPVQEVEPVDQEEVMQEEVPVVQEANVAPNPTPVVAVPVLPNDARNQVPAILSC